MLAEATVRGLVAQSFTAGLGLGGVDAPITDRQVVRGWRVSGRRAAAIVRFDVWGDGLVDEGVLFLDGAEARRMPFLDEAGGRLSYRLTPGTVFEWVATLEARDG